MKLRKFTASEVALAESRIRASAPPKQCDFVFDPARFISLLCGRGAGKTMAVLFRLILTMLVGDPVSGRGANCLYLAKNREQARGIVWSDLKDLIHRLGFDSLAKFNEVRSELTLANGSFLKLMGFDERDEIEKPRGKSWHAVAIDESGSARTDILARFIDEVIGPRLIGWIALLGTPGYLLEGIFYEATRPGSDKHRPYADRAEPGPEGWQWSSHAWSVKDGADAGIAAIKQIYEHQLADKLRKGYSDSNPKWLREGMGQWAQDDTTNVYVYRALDASTGAEFNQWTPVVAATDSTRWARLPPAWDPKTWSYAIAMDIGFKDAFALEAFAYSYQDPSRTMWHIGEFYKTKQSSKAIATLLLGDGLSIDKPGGILGELGWPDFLIADYAGQGDMFAINMKQDYGLVIPGVDKHPKYKDPAVETVNADMFEGRFKILAGSHLARELVSLQWVVDANGKRMQNPRQANHACDALLYFRMSVSALLPSFSIGAVAQASTNAAPSSPQPAKPSRSPAASSSEDGWSTEGDGEGWLTGSELEGDTEGGW